MLKPCPFCGSCTAPMIIKTNDIERVHCLNDGTGCGASGPYGRVNDTQKVIDEWNDCRATLDCRK